MDLLNTYIPVSSTGKVTDNKRFVVQSLPTPKTDILQRCLMLESKILEEKIQRLEEIIQNEKSNGRDLELWIHSNELPNDIKEEIILNMSHILEGIE